MESICNVYQRRVFSCLMTNFCSFNHIISVLSYTHINVKGQNWESLFPREKLNDSFTVGSMSEYL